MILYDYHMHSSHSGDSKEPAENMINAAIKKGFMQICFTEHNDPFFPYVKPEEAGMFDLDVEAYLKDIDILSAKYQDKISVLHGVEIGLQPDILPYCSNYIQSYPFDFVIGSSHVAGKIDPYFPMFFEGRTVKEAINVYFEEILYNVSNYDDFDVYGHLDYVLRYSDFKDVTINIRDHFEVIEAILKTLISKNKGIELNTGGIRTKLKRINPHRDIVALYKELGGEIITVGADSHEIKYIGCDFDIAHNLLKETGFDYITIFKKRKPEFIKI